MFECVIGGGDDGGKDVHYFWFDLVNSGHMYRM